MFIDSLGWYIPNNWENHALLFLKEVFLNFSNNPLILRPYHPNEGIEGPYLCNKRCWRYLLQKDGSSCGVIALIMVAIAVIEQEYFRERLSYQHFLKYQTQFYVYICLKLINRIKNNKKRASDN